MEEKKQKSPLVAGLISWTKTIIIAVLLALLITRVLIINTSVMSGSMENTIMTGDRVISNRLAYINSDPKRFDIVIFEYPFEEPTIHYVKRIIGLPGETVEIADGKVYINGSTEPLPDDFVNQESEPEGDFGPYTIPEDHYFFLGDNRNNSLDSKNWPSPYVHRDRIKARAMFVYYPHFSIIKSYTAQ